MQVLPKISLNSFMSVIVTQKQTEVLHQCTFNETVNIRMAKIDVLPCGHCCSKQAMSITKLVFVFVVLVIQHVHAPYCHMWSASL
jgi:hypothetical protein